MKSGSVLFSIAKNRSTKVISLKLLSMKVLVQKRNGSSSKCAKNLICSCISYAANKVHANVFSAILG